MKTGNSVNATLHSIVEQIEEGDEFEIFAWECIADEVIDCEARPYIRLRKKSVSGYMEQSYRLEWADPTDEDDETLAMKADRKSGWDVRFECAPSEVQLNDEPVATEASADPEPVVMTDGGVDQDEVERGPNGYPYADNDMSGVSKWATGDYHVSITREDGEGVSANFRPEQLKALRKSIDVALEHDEEENDR